MSEIFYPIAILVLAVLPTAWAIWYFGIKGVSKEHRSADWKLDTYSTNVDVDFSPKAGNILAFDFPDAYPGVHMISKRVTGLPLGGMLSITFIITGDKPVFEAAGLTPELRLYIGAQRNYSLGPKNACELKLGKQTLMVPLTADNWKTVDGFPCNYDDAHKRMFEKSVVNSSVVAFIFGDEHGNAHGANLTSGSAHFELIAFAP